MIGSGDSQGKGEHLNSTQAGTDKQPASQPMEHGEQCSLNSMAATITSTSCGSLHSLHHSSAPPHHPHPPSRSPAMLRRRSSICSLLIPVA